MDESKILTEEERKDNVIEYTHLGRLDDLLTNLLIDQQSLWFKTRKFHPNYPKLKKTPIQLKLTLQDLIYRWVVLKGSVTEGTIRIKGVDLINQLVFQDPNISTKSAKEHIARYLSIYHPDAGFELTDTNLYDQNQCKTKKSQSYKHAKVTATKKFKVGEMISYLMGLFSPIDEDLLEKLKSQGQDFSVMVSNRTLKNCLLLGPARFVNHDCNPNAKFMFLAPHIITFRIIKEINFGEEITVSYGENYFGVNNSECLCKTCHGNNNSSNTNEHTTLKKGQYSIRKRKIDTDKVLNDKTLLPKNKFNVPYFEQSLTKLNRDIINKKNKNTRSNNNNEDKPNCLWCYNPCKTSIITPSTKPKLFKIGIKVQPDLSGLVHPMKEGDKLCKRCNRHFEMFGIPWPHRQYPKKLIPNLKQEIILSEEEDEAEDEVKQEEKKKPKVQENLPPTPSPTHSTISILPEINLNNIPKELYKFNDGNDYKRDLVFIDPWDNKSSYFWPAILVPLNEIDTSTMIPIKDKKRLLVVRRLDNNNYHIVDKRGTYNFNPNDLTFKTFLKLDNNFLNRAGIRKALCYFLTQHPPPNFMWRKWLTKYASEEWYKRNPEFLNRRRCKLGYQEEKGLIEEYESQNKKILNSFKLNTGDQVNAIFPTEGYMETLITILEVLWWDGTLPPPHLKLNYGLNYLVKLENTDTQRYITPNQVIPIKEILSKETLSSSNSSLPRRTKRIKTLS